MTPSTVLVHGATGTQGGPVARRLLASGVHVRALTRDASGAADLAAAGAEVVLGDQRDLDSLVRAGRGADAAFVMGAASVPAADYERQVRNGLQAARDAGIAHVVLATSGMVPDEASTPSLDAKRAVVAAAAEFTPGAVVLTTTIYLENLMLVVEALRGGVLPYPIPDEIAVAWQSLDDHAAMAVAALGRPDLAGRTLDGGGPDIVTGSELASRIGELTGRAVSYAAVPPSAFGGQLEPFLGPEVARMIAENYEYEGGRGAHGIAPRAAAVSDELGVTPTPLDSWLATTLVPVLAAAA